MIAGIIYCQSKWCENIQWRASVCVCVCLVDHSVSREDQCSQVPVWWITLHVKIQTPLKCVCEHWVCLQGLVFFCVYKWQRDKQPICLSVFVHLKERKERTDLSVFCFSVCLCETLITTVSNQRWLELTDRHRAGQRVCPLATRGPLSSNQPSLSCLAFQQDACLPQSQHMTVVNVVRFGRGNKRPAGQNKRVRPKHEYPHSMCRITSAFYRLGSKNWYI